jgi:hypothetical protein
MVNLFAFAGEGSTRPDSLLSVADPIGPANDETIQLVFAWAGRIVLCWGQHKPKVAELVSRRLASIEWACVRPTGEQFLKVGTLGRTKSGAPRHPLRLGYETPFEPLRFHGERLLTGREGS